jgi:hypothetical protein
VHDAAIVRVEQSHPTLEPELAKGNANLVGAALDAMGINHGDPLSPQEVADLFASAKKAKAATDEAPAKPAVPAGAAARRKGEFAMEFAGLAKSARDAGESVAVPGPVAALLDFLFADLHATSTPPTSASTAGPSGADDGDSLI